MAKPGPKALESAHWGPYADAIAMATRHYGEPGLALKKLDEFERREKQPLHRKWMPDNGKPRLLKPDETVELDLDWTWIDDTRRQLEPGWERSLKFSLNGEPGFLFVWKPDLQEFFGDAEPPSQQTQEKLVKSGRPIEYAYEEIREELVRRVWRNHRLTLSKTEPQYADDLLTWSERRWKKQPPHKEIRQLVKHTIATLRLLSK